VNVSAKAKKVLLSSVAKKSVASLVKSANTACAFYQYQPMETVKIKKLRKF